MVVCAMRLAENLRQGASHFQRQSDDMRRLMWWRNFKMKCIVFLLVFSIVRLPPTPPSHAFCGVCVAAPCDGLRFSFSHSLPCIRCSLSSRLGTPTH
jgi:hypothetical protein